MGINQFTHLTQEEFVETYLKTIVPPSMLKVDVNDTFVDVGDVNWRDWGAVSDVKNQGSCGSCWAFSAVGALEGLSKIAQGNLQTFSEQQLVDCSRSYGNAGCNGGWMDNAFSYVHDHGIRYENEYPYRANDGNCQMDDGSFRNRGHADVQGCDNLANELSYRPISVAVDASNWSPYRGGIFNNCGGNVNHGVLLVGVTGDYWYVKNSWSGSWGEGGYIRLSRGNTCAICNNPSYPFA